MSLEIAIQENTQALHALILAWSAKAHPEETAAHTAKTVTKAEAKKPAASLPAPAQSAEPETVATTGTTEGVTFAAARELVLQLAKTHREGIKTINAAHGIPKLSALLTDENDFESVADQAKLEAVYADLQALGA
ncbi:hypothetical protein RGU70_13735 [Herbaspirillum sp. RTI4]|uniref:hypothetical protein n=1 Tax=Herbaspirillum sp. RTI4 TaxID=3048640 RepID=UPI002AB489E4|nr:hypothetical protein [Herbaspirillum sp. RTI4]MDY7579375.1 hypothetical protein [Herbaspirillum sp. RTI4]MEA9980289.1 hypothetical protein [Herbaspirillum sp. RTI4]